MAGRRGRRGLKPCPTVGRRSGKVNMVSFYTDSPRLGVRNTHAPERSQDRIGGTLWENPGRYLEQAVP